MKRVTLAIPKYLFVGSDIERERMLIGGLARSLDSILMGKLDINNSEVYNFAKHCFVRRLDIFLRYDDVKDRIKFDIRDNDNFFISWDIVFEYTERFARLYMEQ